MGGEPLLQQRFPTRTELATQARLKKNEREAQVARRSFAAGKTAHRSTLRATRKAQARLSYHKREARVISKDFPSTPRIIEAAKSQARSASDIKKKIKFIIKNTPAFDLMVVRRGYFLLSGFT